jgi:hypothetical protein
LTYPSSAFVDAPRCGLSLAKLRPASVKPRAAFLQTSDTDSAASPALAESKDRRRMRIHCGTRIMRFVHQHILRFFQSFGSSLVSRIATLVSAKVTAFMSNSSIRAVNRCGDLQIGLQIAQQSSSNCVRARAVGHNDWQTSLCVHPKSPTFHCNGRLVKELAHLIDI